MVTAVIHSYNLTSPVPLSCKFSLDGYYVWGSTVIKGHDNRYHMIFSMWEKQFGFDGWMTNSVFGYAVSDCAAGPYRYEGVILEGSGDGHWDGRNLHNECLLYEDGVYYLYYTGAAGDGSFWDNRNHQRVGVMTAPHPKGPWKRFDCPLVDVEGENLLTATPNVIKMPDGQFMMVYKTVLPGPMPFGGKVVHKVAVAEHPLGPFVTREQPFLSLPDFSFPIDDHVQWICDGVYYALVKDNQNQILGKGIGLVLFSSADGINWKLSEDPFVLGQMLDWEDGTTESYVRLEMPKPIFDGEKIVALALAARPTDEEKLSYNVQIPLKF